MLNEYVDKNKLNEDELNNYEQLIQQEVNHFLFLKINFYRIKLYF